MKKILLIVIFCLTLFTTSSCFNLIIIKGEGDIINTTYLIGNEIDEYELNFNHLQRSNNELISITYEESAIKKIVVSTNKNIIDKLDFNISSDQITLKSNSLNRFYTSEFSIVIYGIKIHKLELSGTISLDLPKIALGKDFKITTSGFFDGEIDCSNVTMFKTNNSGVSDIELKNLIADEAICNFSGVTEIDFDDIQCDNLEITSSGTTKADGDGNVIEGSYKLSGASKLEFKEIKHNNLNIKCSGTSEAIITIDGKLDINLSGASKLIYYGNPKINIDSISGTSVIKNND